MLSNKRPHIEMGRQTDWWWVGCVATLPPLQPEEGWRRPDNEWAAEFVVRQTGPLGASHQQSLKVSQSLLLLIARRYFSPKKIPDTERALVE